VINEAMIKKFISYLDVSKTTLNKYEYCLNVFLGCMKSKGIVTPLRSDILRYKTEMEQKYTSPQQ
jgi:hypothetical protein